MKRIIVQERFREPLFRHPCSVVPASCVPPRGQIAWRRFLFVLAVPIQRRVVIVLAPGACRYHTKKRAVAASQNLGLAPVQPCRDRCLPNLPASRELCRFFTCRTGTARVSLFYSGRLSWRTLRLCAAPGISPSSKRLGLWRGLRQSSARHPRPQRTSRGRIAPGCPFSAVLVKAAGGVRSDGQPVAQAGHAERRIAAPTHEAVGDLDHIAAHVRGPFLRCGRIGLPCHGNTRPRYLRPRNKPLWYGHPWRRSCRLAHRIPDSAEHGRPRPTKDR